MSNLFSARRTQQSRLLHVIEYTSAVASVVGAIASALSQQVVYVAAPMSLSLCLNLVNRRRFEQQTEQRFNGTIAQIDQRLLNLDQQVLEQSTQTTQSLTERITHLSEQLITSKQSQNETASDFSELRSQLSQLQERFTTTQQAQNATSTDLGQLQTRLSQLNAQLTAIQQHQAGATMSQTGLEAQFSQVRENLSQEIQAIRQQLQAATLNLDGLEALQQAFPGLAEQIAQLQDRLRAIEARQTSEPLDRGIENRLPTIEMLPTLAAPEFVDVPTTPKLELEQTPILFPPEGQEFDVEDLVLNLGIDFGTSFTKVCFRDVATDRSEIVTFTDEVTRLEEALLPAKIGILPDGTLITGLTASEWEPYINQVQTTVEFIKMRLASFDLPQGLGSWQLEKLSGMSHEETVENLCAYYLSRVIIRAQAWIRQNKSERLINQKIGWTANVGVPVEYCDSPAIQRFQKVLSLAWLLSNEPQTEWMTIENLSDRIKPLRAKLEETTIDCHAIPEIAAEVWSLLNSREVDEGFYILFDVGDGTLDGSSFRYWNEAGEKKVDFFFGKVNPLGVTAFSQRLAQELGVAETDIKNTVCGTSTRYFDRVQTSMARKEIQRLVANVVCNGSQKYGEHGFRLTWPGFEKPLEILIGGGGGQIAFYEQTIISTHKDFQQKNAGIPEYTRRSLPSPKDLETNGISKHEFHRFAVAYGLSIPEGEQPELRLPSEMERVKPKTFKQDDSGQPPNYEDMRGSW
ncbi:MAG: hypothetical protein HC780_02880 [Leptolyngbyaceae cyanobacterium CSU_1_3]|nr:hypothetical protein [Leptolyngbyaceae cyanobacterium CSU_1_3]